MSTSHEPLHSPESDLTNYQNSCRSVVLPDGTSREPLGSGEITGILGVGGMATVYEIWNNQLEVNRAVKLLHPNHTEDTRQRFQTEIKITAKLHHPNIIEIHAVGQWNSLPYIEMERIDGFTLEKIINDRGALPVEVCSSIGVMIGRALRYAHNQEYVIYGKNYHGVIHRDLKPSNVMLGRNGLVKLMDFGIARPTDASIHTTDGAILGTMQYLSPEQLEGVEPDVRTDIYSLGTLLYELITGVKVFPEQNVSKLMISKVKNNFTSIGLFETKIPLRLGKLVHNCLVHDREKRIQNASEFLSKIIAIHKSITPLSPEEILISFMREMVPKERRVLKVRKRASLSLTAAIVAVAICSFFLVSFMAERFLSKTIKTESVPLDSAFTHSAAVRMSNISDSVKKTSADSSFHTVSLAAGKKHAVISQKDTAAKPIDNAMREVADRADLIETFFNLVQSKKYSQALELFPKLPSVMINDKVTIYRIRALSAVRDKKELKNVLFSRLISDGEVYLEKAKYYIENTDYDKALQEIESCTKSSASYMEANTLRLERLYYTALCKSRQFDLVPSQETRNAALDSWFEIKSELQIAKDHKYFKAADSEMQRITKKMNSSRG